jgi:hypothetical protein
MDKVPTKSIQKKADRRYPSLAYDLNSKIIVRHKTIVAIEVGTPSTYITIISHEKATNKTSKVALSNISTSFDGFKITQRSGKNKVAAKAIAKKVCASKWSRKPDSRCAQSFRAVLLRRRVTRIASISAVDGRTLLCKDRSEQCNESGGSGACDFDAYARKSNLTSACP